MDASSVHSNRFYCCNKLLVADHRLISDPVSLVSAYSQYPTIDVNHTGAVQRVFRCDSYLAAGSESYYVYCTSHGLRTIYRRVTVIACDHSTLITVRSERSEAI